MRELGVEAKELPTCATTASRLAKSKRSPIDRRSAPATAFKPLDLDVVCRFAMLPSCGSGPWPQSENRGGSLAMHAGFGQERGITGERIPGAGERDASALLSPSPAGLHQSRALALSFRRHHQDGRGA